MNTNFERYRKRKCDGRLDVCPVHRYSVTPKNMNPEAIVSGLNKWNSFGILSCNTYQNNVRYQIHSSSTTKETILSRTRTFILTQSTKDFASTLPPHHPSQQPPSLQPRCKQVGHRTREARHTPASQHTIQHLQRPPRHPPQERSCGSSGHGTWR